MELKIKWSGKAIEYTEEEISTVVEVMRNGDPQTQGKYLQQFEADFSNYLLGQPCFGVTNATHALELIADLIDLKPGDEVIIPGHTYCASAIPFARKGAKIIWADLDPDTFLVNADIVKNLITTKTKAIVVVHLYGMIIPDIEKIAEVARDANVRLVEDCAQALGAILNNKPVGTFGDFAAYSFHGQKNITTMGEGGILTLKDKNLVKLIPGLRHNGHAPFQNKTDYWKPAMSNVDLDMEGIWPHNFSLTEAQAALGSVLLKRLDSLTELRRDRANKFRSSLMEFSELKFQKIISQESHSHHLLVARFVGKNSKNRDDLISLLSKKYGIQVIVQYYPLYRYDLFKKMKQADSDCKEVDSFFDNMISFPFHIWMSDKDFEYMIESVKNAIVELRS